MKILTRLENLEFFAYHGIYEEEKTKGGMFRVDVSVEEEVAVPRDFTRLEEQVNYEKLFNIVQEEMQVRRNLIEEVASNILLRIGHHLTDHHASIQVKITKQNPAGKFGSGSASIELVG